MNAEKIRIYKRSLAALAALAATLLIALAISFAITPYPLAPFENVRASWRASDAWLLDRNGEPLSRVRIDRDRRRGDWVRVEDVSPALLNAVVAAEDKRFRDHSGVDWLAMLNAFRQSAGGDRRGGSTLTMQLASYLHPELEMGGRRGVIDKWRQMRQGAALERAWTKDEILEAWLNLTPFRGEVEGVDAAARALLGKRASGLNRPESALLAALVRAPNASSAYVARRACGLLEGDERACTTAKMLAAQGLRAAQMRDRIEGDAAHLARKLLTKPGERFVSTLDARVQRRALESLQRNLRELHGRNVEDGAVIVLDNATGDVLAWVGSSGALSQAQQVDGVVARRQAGSTLKPFLYAAAIERRLLTAASILEDSPLAIVTPGGLYVPQNYDHTFRGSVSLRESLASSLNVPAVRTLTLVGYEPFHRQLKGLGLETLTRDAEHYGYALALGGADVTLAQLTNAYRTLANRGALTAIQTAAVSADSRHAAVRAIDPAAAFIVADILGDAAARALTFGLASPLATRYPASVKTGTSKDMRDNWAIGFTGAYTVGVWVGNFSGAPMHDVSGVSGAAPIWRDVMDFLHEGQVPAPGIPPTDLVRMRIAYAGDLEPSRDEWFLAGTETARITQVGAVARKASIETPPRGAVYAIDPDIPRDRQRIALRARGAGPGSQYRLDDGQRISADAPYLWFAPPGKRQIALLDADGREVDRVDFQVRGLRPVRKTVVAD